MIKTNRLNTETSPYLRQHAHNPVDWYPWGEEALSRAREEDKPLLLSIGYAACHWCHVMERESFEDEDTAALMNAHFINVKIDREERPDLDHLYMEAVQAITGSGGWPLHVFLTPSLEPFFGGTYFPPTRMYNRPSWKELLEAIHEAYTARKEDITGQAAQLTAQLRNAGAPGRAPDAPDYRRCCGDMYAQIMQSADRRYGGFGQAPKFPGTLVLQFLLRYHHVAPTSGALPHALHSLDAMIYGGIYDQLGGGMARYATDNRWLVPHFEKMLYDNALLADCLAEAYQLSGRAEYREKLEHTLLFMSQELGAPDGGFYTALDADSEGEEGQYYVWTYEEVADLLGKDLPLFSDYYHLSPAGNWEGRNILWAKGPLAAYAAEKNLSEQALKEVLDRGKALLLGARAQRPRPLLDDKILLGWNALAAAACGRAFAATGDERWKDVMIRNLGFLSRTFRDPATGGLYHGWKAGRGHPSAFLDDYAFYMRALLVAQEVTGENDYLDEAAAWAAYVTEHFSDEEGLFFYFTPDTQQDMLLRKAQIYDGATPSGNAVMATVLQRIAILTDKPAFRARAVAMLDAMAAVAARYPTSFGAWALGLWDQAFGLHEVAITGPGTGEALARLLRHHLPGMVVMASESGGQYPLLQGRAPGEETALYLCRDYVCRAPLSSAEALARQIEEEWQAQADPVSGAG